MVGSWSSARLAVCAAAAAAAVLVLYRRRRRRKALAFVPWEQVDEAGDAVLVVDCTHPKLQCLTHHKMPYSPPEAIKGDSTSDMVLNALSQDHALVRSAAAVSVNHFDIDAFVSVWSLQNPEIALQYLDALHAASNIGDFRELDLDAPGADLGLKACCWLNTVERRLFSRPFEPGDKDKWPYFLGGGRFASFLRDPAPFRSDWQEEHARVLADVELLQLRGKVRRYPEIGLCVIEAPRPLHYYALFGATKGCDIVLASYGEGAHVQVEVEQKYTQFVNLCSRPTHPRIGMDRLVSELNALEERARAEGGGGGEGGKECPAWTCERIVDSGPLMRLDLDGAKLTKAQRYGHPYERPLHRSNVRLPQIEALLVRYLQHALDKAPKKFEWKWAELHAYNDNIDWTAWKEA